MVSKSVVRNTVFDFVSYLKWEIQGSDFDGFLETHGTHANGATALYDVGSKRGNACQKKAWHRPSKRLVICTERLLRWKFLSDKQE